MTPLKAIRAKCLECAGSRHAVLNCRNGDCALYALRFGKNPHRKGIGRPGGNPLLNSTVRLSFLAKKGIVGAGGKGFSEFTAPGAPCRDKH